MTWARVAAITVIIAALAAYATGYGWLVHGERLPDDTPKSGHACRYQTLRGIRTAAYLGDCPKFSTTKFPETPTGQ